MSQKKYAIEVRNVKKSFFLPNHRNDSFKRAITQAFKKKDKGGSTFNALNGVSFNVEKGDFFGILGRNGSGKSTLLKIISEIYQPTSGSVKHDGKVVSFIELGVGFKADLTGRENVFLNGALLGFSKQEIEGMYDDIVEFAELEKFMDQRLKNYSSGMKVRLAFSVAIRAKADILILDEVLAVGDAAFQRKCYDYFETLKNNGKTVILVTHGMGNVRKFCNKAIVIDDGKIIFNGGADEAADEYLRLFYKPQVSLKDEQIIEHDSAHMDHSLSYDNEAIRVSMKVGAKEVINDAVVGITMQRQDNNAWVYRWTTDNDNVSSVIDMNRDSKLGINLSIQNIFPDGDYSVNLWIKSRDRRQIYYVDRTAYVVKVSRRGEEAKYWKPKSTFTIMEI